MYIDFHTHGKLAKRLPFSTAYTDWLFGEAKGAGLDALCLTEHFNTLQFDQVYGYLLDKYDREGDTLVTEQGLRIFAGMETDIAEGGHILCVGIPEEILVENKENCVRIPMIGDIRSLNLGNSAAIILYEALRQNGFKGMETEGDLHRLKW